MRFVQNGETLSVTGMEELSARNSGLLQTEVERLLGAATTIEIDLSGASFVDCCGVGALIALRNYAQENRGVQLTLVNPPSAVQRLFNLIGIGCALPMEEGSKANRPKTSNPHPDRPVSPVVLCPPRDVNPLLSTVAAPVGQRSALPSAT